MDPLFMNFENSKTSELCRLLHNHSDKINFRRSDNYVVLSNLNIFHTWKYMKRLYKNNEFKIAAPTWNEEFE